MTWKENGARWRTFGDHVSKWDRILCPQDFRGEAGELPPGFEGGGITQPHEPLIYAS